MSFVPHGFCFLWNRNIVLLHVVSDAGIAIAYGCLSLLLWYFIHKRPDIPFSWLFAMFGSFIFSCGTTHVMAIWTLWHSDYIEEGLLKAITAMISLSTAAALFIHLPQALALPSPAQMRAKEEQLEAALAAEREINNFRRNIVTTISHEYRTPLASILSSVELLERNPTSDRSPRHFESIKRKITDLTKLLNDALILDKSESGKLEFQPEEMDAIAYCLSILDEIDCRRHSLEIEASGGAVGMFDPRLLNSLFTNLIYNATKYSSPGTAISIRLAREENNFVLEVEDRGIGIPESEISRIFDSYFRASNVETAPGTGVGLAIVQKCVSLHGGEISVRSEVGVGTTFRVTLPVRDIIN
jgi:signal transduction histidine kinase